MDFCQKYGFNRFFNDLPQGLDTLAGEGGINLSGGQQQLVGFARALYRCPSLLLLDEPTSAMDSKTEQFVIDLLQKIKPEIAVLLVTHRTGLTEYADRVYVLNC